MQHHTHEIKVSEIREGDEFRNPDSGYIHWRAMSNAENMDGLIVVQVEYRDGGFGSRTWTADSDTDICITRVQ